MGASPPDEPGWFAAADPAQLLPVVVPQLIVHGTEDRNVPLDRSLAYADLVAEPDALDVVVFEGADHFNVIDPAHESWAAVLERLAQPS